MSFGGTAGLRAVSLAGIALLLFVPAGAAVQGFGGAPAGHVDRALFHSGPVHGSSSSTNWAGYAVTASKGSVSFVAGSWIVPKIHGSCPSAYQYAAFWVGIDGYNSNSVEQTGTDSDCQSGHATYYAWYEFYPAASHLITKLKVSPGNVITAQVTYASGAFTVKITNTNTSVSFSKSKSMSASRSSAEWIAEAPSSGSGVLPLADFGTVHFGYRATGVTSTGEATVSGTTAPIGSFSSVVAITIITTSGSNTKASTSALTPDGTSFNVSWVRAGP